MSERELESLRLDREQAERLADFYEAYVEFAMPGVARSPDLARVPELFEGSGVRRRADVASGLRLAGQWAMLFDLQRASSLLLRSALVWQGLGHGYG